MRPALRLERVLRQPTVTASALALALLAGVATAQGGRGRNPNTVYVPAANQSVDAAGVVLWALAPFESRRQLILPSQSLNGLAGRELIGLAVRRNTAPEADAVGGRLRLRIEVSETQTALENASPRFADNRGSSVSVFDGVVSLADRAPFSTDPALPGWDGPDVVRLMLSQPLRLAGGRSLCIETETVPFVDAAGNTDSPFWPIDGASQRFSPLVRDLGGNCVDPGDPLPAGVETNALVLGATARFHLSTRPAPGRTALLNLGFGMGVQGYDLTGLGAPGCESHLFALTSLASALQPVPVSGQRDLATADLDFPDLAVLALIPLRAQWLVLDPQANQLGVQTSNALEFRLASPRSRTSVWIEAASLTEPTGKLSVGRQPVLELILR